MGLVGDLSSALPAGSVIVDPAQLRTYESDALTGWRAIPLAVVLPRSTAEVAAAVGVCRQHGAPFVARGAGTGLSGGAVPVAEGIVIGLSRMNQVLAVDAANRRGAPAAGGHESRGEPRRGAARSLLRARSVQPAGVHDRRERGRELGRRALPEARVDHPPRSRAGAGHRRRDGRAARPHGSARPGQRRRRARRGRSASSPRWLSACCRCRSGWRRCWRRSTQPTRPARRCRRSSPPASCRARSR